MKSRVNLVFKCSDVIQAPHILALAMALDPEENDIDEKFWVMMLQPALAALAFAIEQELYNRYQDGEAMMFAWNGDTCPMRKTIAAWQHLCANMLKTCDKQDAKGGADEPSR